MCFAQLKSLRATINLKRRPGFGRTALGAASSLILVLTPSAKRKERKVLLMVAFHQLVQWFVQHPLAAATLLYAAAVCGVLVYAFFEPRAQT